MTDDQFNALIHDVRKIVSTGWNQELRAHHVRPRRSGRAGRRTLGCLRHPDFGHRLRGGRDRPQTEKYVGGKSTMNLPHYFGPCTPAGAPHHYTFTLIATDLEPTALQPGITRDEVMKALDGHAKGATGIIGTFSKPSNRPSSSGDKGEAQADGRRLNGH